MRTRSHAPGPRRLVRFPAWVCRQLSAVTLNSADAVLPGVSICLAKLDGPQKHAQPRMPVAGSASCSSLLATLRW